MLQLRAVLLPHRNMDEVMHTPQYVQPFLMMSLGQTITLDIRYDGVRFAEHERDGGQHYQRALQQRLATFIHVEFLEVMDITMNSLLRLRMMPISLFCSSYRGSVASTLSTSRIFWSINFFTAYVLYIRPYLNARGWLLSLAHGILHFLSVFDFRATL